MNHILGSAVVCCQDRPMTWMRAVGVNQPTFCAINRSCRSGRFVDLPGRDRAMNAKCDEKCRPWYKGVPAIVDATSIPGNVSCTHNIFRGPGDMPRQRALLRRGYSDYCDRCPFQPRARRLVQHTAQCTVIVRRDSCRSACTVAVPPIGKVRMGLVWPKSTLANTGTPDSWGLVPTI
jgi:hypothetical protein